MYSWSEFQTSKATKQHQWSIVILMMIQHIPCKQALVCHVAVESELYFNYAIVLLHCIDTVLTRVVFRPLDWSTHLIAMASCMSCLLLRSSDCYSQHFCDVCKYIFRMDWSNGHNNQCSNCVFKVYAYCHHCTTVHEVLHRLGSTMLCLSNSSLSSTIHHSLAHHHPMGVNKKSTFFKVTMICMTTMK